MKNRISGLFSDPASSPLHTYFSQIYGDRWTGLYTSLLSERPKVKLQSPFHELTNSASYELDPASLQPTQALEIRPGDSVLDMCSAPGGKALAMLFEVCGQMKLMACDISSSRLQRLKRNLRDHLPPQVFEHLEIRRCDAARLGQAHPEEFDKVLLDAPCTAERHTLTTLEKTFNPKLGKALSIRQHALLCSGLDALKFNGHLVYSTCSIDPRENDGVIEKLMKSRKGQFAVTAISHFAGEDTKFGKILLPDRQNGAGPIYYAKLTKLNPNPSL